MTLSRGPGGRAIPEYTSHADRAAASCCCAPPKWAVEQDLDLVADVEAREPARFVKHRRGRSGAATYPEVRQFQLLRPDLVDVARAHHHDRADATRGGLQCAVTPSLQVMARVEYAGQVGGLL